MRPSIEITQLFLHFLLDKWLAACPHGSSVAMQLQGLLLAVCTFNFLDYCISTEIKTSWVLHDNRFLKKKSKNKYIAV